MNTSKGTHEIYLRPSDYDFLRGIGVQCVVYCELHTSTPLPPSRQPKTGERRHHRGCYLCQRMWRKRRRQLHHVQLELPLSPMPTDTLSNANCITPSAPLPSDVDDEIRYPIRVYLPDGRQTIEIDYRDFEILMERDPRVRTLPSPDPNKLILTAEDYVMLWRNHIMVD
jgi:hypothetical protein